MEWGLKQMLRLDYKNLAEIIPAEIIPAEIIPAEIIPAEIIPAEIIPAEVLQFHPNKTIIKS